MNESLTFITTGVVETFEDKLKEKVCYLFRIIYYSIALVFTIGVVHEFIIYLQTDSIDATIIGRISNPLDKDVLIYNFLFSLIFPFYAAYSLWYCQAKFDYKKISLSISLILATIVCILIQPLNILPRIAGYDLTAFFFLPIITIALYLIISNILSYKSIAKFRTIWKKHQLIFIYLYVVLFIIFMLYYTEYNILNIIVNVIIAAFMALMLIYVRRLLGFYYAITLHYVLTLPVIIATSYMLFDQF